MSRDDHDDRPRRSWREIDRMRDKASHRTEERRPRGEKAEARARFATRQYLDSAGRELFGGSKGTSQQDPLAKALRDAHGSPGLAAACQAYLAETGVPEDTSLLSLFLDAREPTVVKAGLGGLAALHERGDLSMSSGLQRQLRILAEDSDDDIAYAAEDLLDE